MPQQKPEQRIECESGKLLFRACSAGIKVWCSLHKAEELITWGQLAEMERSLNVPSMQIVIRSSTTCITA